MKIRRFEGKDVQDALRQAEAALGPDAVILQTRRVQDNGLMGLVGKPRVEVLAAIDIAPPEPARAEPPHREQATAPAGRPDELLSLQREVERLRRELSAARESRVPGPGSRVSGGEARGSRYTPEAEAPPFQWAPRAAVGGEAPPPSTPEGLARRIRTMPPARGVELRKGACTTVGLVGPTGVGKTTTIAKIAAAAALGEGRRVALLTLDTYRIGAVEQLETYARLLEVPLTVAYSPEQVRQARAQYAGYDLLLVDTVGCAAGNLPQLERQAALFEAAGTDETHLVLEARSSYATHLDVLDGFRCFRPTHLLLTKLDEAPVPRDVLEATLASGLCLSYVTMGQRVPDDLALAEPNNLALLLTGRP